MSDLTKAWKLYSLTSIIKSSISWLISDYYVVSFRKSGRTWLRMIWARILEQQYSKNINLDTQFMALLTKAPKLTFSHGGTTKTNNPLSFPRWLQRKKVIFLARDPRDVVVSLYHDYTKRHGGYTGSISSFIRDDNFGLPAIILFMNQWAKHLQSNQKSLLLSYEQLSANPAETTYQFLAFVGHSAPPEIIQEALSYASFSNMRAMEAQGTIADQRLLPTDKKDTATYKTRKGKVGSYKEELGVEDQLYVDQMVNEKLDKVFGYDV